MAIIGLSGKKQSGKDTVCKIIQYLTYVDKQYMDFKEFSERINDTIFDYSWQRKLFADKLKDIVCMLIGCTREHLEDNTFKETLLGEEWWYWRDRTKHSELVPYTSIMSKEVTQRLEDNGQIYLVKLTPRLLLQLIGTESGRKIIHPNIWVNALMSEYKAKSLKNNPQLNVADYSNSEFPNWIITDCRFPNEVKAIKDRGGLVFRIEREGLVSTDRHESETVLDNYDQFDDVIYNRSDIPSLIDTMQQVLKIHNIL